MHESAYQDAARFVERYLAGSGPLRIADVGSRDVNGTLRALFDRWEYVGLDIREGGNVDLVLSDTYDWPEVRSGSFDVAVSTQCLEHVARPWQWVREIARIVRRGGLVYLCAPNTHEFHEHPIDCWRVWPAGMRGLLAHAGLTVCEAYANGTDTTGIGRKEL